MNRSNTANAEKLFYDIFMNKDYLAITDYNLA
jgi:hypothetical protein